MKKKHYNGTIEEDNPEWTDEMFRNAKYGIDGLAEIIGKKSAEKFRKIGRPKSENPKKNGTLRLSGDLWDDLRASGAGYHTRIEKVLRNALEHGQI